MYDSGHLSWVRPLVVGWLRIAQGAVIPNDTKQYQHENQFEHA